MMKVLSTLSILPCLLLAACAGTPTPEPPDIASITSRKKDSAEMVNVPGGTFQMGSREEDPDAFGFEFPEHPVTLDAYRIDKHEVTNARYERCVADGVCGEPSFAIAPVVIAPAFKGENQSIGDVFEGIIGTWEDADTYCQWAGARLPTEVEWEYAARGPDRHIYPWGNDPPDAKLLNFSGNMGHTTDVGSYPGGASWVGALDMAGNVWEWVSDWYAADYYAASPTENPTGPDTGDRKLLRGGSWYDYYRVTRTAARYWLKPDTRDSWLGFRCADGSDD